MHADDAGQRRGDRIQAREKFCDEDRLKAPRDKDLLRAPNTGIGFESNRAEPRQDPMPSVSAQSVVRACQFATK